MQPLAQAKRQKVLIIMLVIVLVITAFIWYSGYKKGPPVEEFIPLEEGVVTGPLATEERLKEIKLDISTLDDSVFKALKSHGLLPVTVGETGRENPLEPY